MARKPLAALALAVACAAAPAAAAGADGAVDDLAPGHERVLLRDRRLLRAKVLERGAQETTLAREDGLRVIVRTRDVERVLAADEEVPARVQGTSRVFLRDGGVVRGVVVARTPDGVLLEADGERRFVPGVRYVLGPEPALRLRATLVLPDPRATPAEGIVTLRSGATVRGLVLGVGDDAVLVQTADGERTAVLRSTVRRIEDLGGRSLRHPPLEEWSRDPARARHLAVANAVPPAAGTVVVSQRMTTTSLHAAPWRHLSLSLETALPIWHSVDAGWNGVASVAAHHALGRVHLAAGLLTFASGGGHAGYAFAAATLDARAFQVTVYGGPPLPGVASLGAFGDQVAAVGATWRFHPRWAIATEHWLGGEAGAWETMNAVALRTVAFGFALDLGAARVPERDVPVPWVGIARAVPFASGGAR